MANLKDFATALIQTAPSPATSGTSLVLASAMGVRFPAVPFNAVAHPDGQLPTLDNAERVTVTAVSTDTLTIVRAQGNTTAKSIAAGWRLSNAIFADDIMYGSNVFVNQETPSGSVNGTNKNFTLSRGYISGTLEVYVNGLLQAPTTHTTEVSASAGTFSLDTAPLTGDIVRVSYYYSATTGGNAQTVNGNTDADLMPVGAGMDFWGSTLPSSRFMWAYGQAISRTTYASLFALIGTTYGAGDGSTTFNIPDKRGRVSAGKDDMGGTSANRLTNQSGGLNGDVLGATGGAENHTLITSQLPTHSHATIASAAGFDGNIVTGGSWQGAASLSQGGAAFRVASNPSTGTAGSDTPHNNVQPTIICNYIIKVA